jgi:EpsI family protein
MALRSFLACAILLAAGLFQHFHVDHAVPMNKSFENFPRSSENWRMVGEAVFSAAVLDTLRPTDYLSRSYIHLQSRKTVNLYIGYHDGGPDAGEIHSPRHCLPGGGWEQLSIGPVDVEVDGNARQVVLAVYRKDKVDTVFVYWFQSMGAIYSDEYTLKLAEFKNSLLHGRKDAAFIRIATPVQTSREAAVELAVDFVEDFWHVIYDTLPN